MKQRRSWVVRAGVLGAVALLTVAGCGGGGSSTDSAEAGADLTAAGGMEELVSKAKDEGQLLLYIAPRQDAVQEWVQEFQDEYGISVQIYRAASNQIHQRVAQEAQAGRVQGDIAIYSGRAEFEDAVEKGWYDEYTPQDAGEFPEETTIPKHAYPFYATTGAIAWNTNAVSEEVQQKLRKDPLNGLLDPSLKGKIVVNNPLAGGTALLNFALPGVHDAENYGWPYLQKLADQNPAILVGVGAFQDSLVQGTYAASFFATESLFADAALAGAPVEWAYPNPTYGSLFYMGVVHDSPHPNAARLFMEWATSKSGQDRAAQSTGGVSVRKGWVDERELPDWHQPAEDIWFGEIDPALQGEKLEEFKAQWKDMYEQ